MKTLSLTPDQYFSQFFCFIIGNVHFHPPEQFTNMTFGGSQIILLSLPPKNNCSYVPKYYRRKHTANCALNLRTQLNCSAKMLLDAM